MIAQRPLPQQVRPVAADAHLEEGDADVEEQLAAW